MIDKVIEIGKLADPSYGMVFNDIDIRDKKGNITDCYLAEVSFSSNASCPEACIKKISINENNVKIIAESYTWIGNARANSPKIRVTSDKFENVVKALPLLLKHLPKSSGIYREIKEVSDLYIEDFKVGSLTSYKIKDSFINDLGDLKDKRIKLFSIVIDNKKISQNNEYLELLKGRILPEHDKFKLGKCSICGEEARVTDDTKNLRFKYYITDKISFASNFFASNFESFEKNLKICELCYENAIKGENYILKKLNTRLGESLLVIPQNLIPQSTSGDPLKNIEEIFKITNSGIKATIDSLKDLENQFKRLTGVDNYILNLIFYQMEKSSFKIRNYIPDVPSTQIKNINKNLTETYKKFSKLNHYPVDLSYLYKIMSRVSQSTAMNYINKLFINTPFSERSLIFNFMKSLKVLKYDDTKSFSDIPFELIKMLSFIYFFSLMKLTTRFDRKGVKSMENVNEEKENRFEVNYLEDLELSAEQDALVRIGYLISSIGTAQWKNKLVASGSAPPILSKVNFNGMDIQEIKKLVVSIEEKLKQYGLYFKTNSLNLLKVNVGISKNSKSWEISNQENVFYILAGYSIAFSNNFKKKDNTEAEDERNLDGE
jgi:CRISPR-associated protein Csh1